MTKKRVHKIMTLYTKVKTELLLRNEKIEDLLRETGLSPATLSNIKKSRPRRNTYDLLAEYLNLDLLQLYLLPITREEILEEDCSERITSDYDIMETVDKSEMLPLPEGVTIRQTREAARAQEVIKELMSYISEDENREVTWDEYRQRIINERPY